MITLRKFALEAVAPAAITRTNPIDLSGSRAADAMIVIMKFTEGNARKLCK